MRILLCHGYLLKGTGSNQYVQSLARALCAEGHHLVVMSQEDDPRLDFVTTFLREDKEGAAPQVVWEKETGYPGNCMAYKPFIGGLLPVYVLDSYAGFEVKEFTALTGDELAAYVEGNRRALDRMVRQFVPDVIHANHAVMLPYIVRTVAEEQGVPYFVSIHGSAIDFTVRKDERYLAYGLEGMRGARRVLVPSEHTREQVLEVFGDGVEGLERRMTLLPPGVDTEVFHPAETDFPQSVERMLSSLAERESGVTVGDFVGRRGERAPAEPEGEARIEYEVARINGLHPDWLPEPDLAESLRRLAEAAGPFIMFLGKLLETKGIQCAIPALPLVLRDHPEVSLVVVGFGELRGILELMLEALGEGDIRFLKELCDYGNRANSSRINEPFGPVLAFLDDLAGEGTLDEYLGLCMGLDLDDAVLFTGYLTPEEHSEILPYAKALLVPSLGGEAFGMVATEAMACGVVPIASCHSGLAATLEPVRSIWGSDAGALLLDDPTRIVSGISAACRAVLETPQETLRLRGAEMRGVVRQRFSWESIAERLSVLYEENST